MGLGHKNMFGKVAELAKRQDFSTDGGTVYSIVYVTAEPTFTGVIGGYTTLTGDSQGSGSETAETSRRSAATATASQSSARRTSSKSVIAQTTSAATSTAATTLVLTTPAVLSTTSSAGSVAGASTTSSASSTSSNSSSDGLSTGAKAGIAIGVIAVVGLIAAFLLWLLGKKRREREAQAAKDNEKANYGAGSAATEMVTRSPPSSASAPRLSLRPVSRMMPEFMGSSKGRMSGGNMLNTVGESNNPPSRKLGPSDQPRGPSPSAPRPDEQNLNDPFADPQNPFADPEKSVQPSANAPPAINSTPVDPIAAASVVASGALATASKPAPAPAPTPVPAPAPVVPSAALPVPAPIAVPASAPASQPDSQFPLPAPSTPVTPVPIVGAGPGPESPQGNVFRVLMDFKPSMEDELELKSGQLVRMLHEYDDGWALCIRLDRSQQGVVPRTCLASKPSKPKPSHLNQYARPPPGGPMSRPMSPVGMPPRPMSPGGRAMSPAGPRRPMSPAGARRPMSPAGRPMSPAGGRRPMSPHARPMSPAGSFNQPPRPLSPSFRPQPKRSNSPGPYHGRAGPPPMAAVNRRRSNSVGDAWDRRTSPVGPSKLGLGNGIAL